MKTLILYIAIFFASFPEVKENNPFLEWNSKKNFEFTRLSDKNSFESLVCTNDVLTSDIESTVFRQDALHPKGSGTQSNPFLISNLSELYWILINPTSWDKVFKQTSDIDASSSIDWNNGEGWLPIGWDQPFTGDYDGAGFRIVGLSMNRSIFNHLGFFGSVKNAVLKNIVLSNVNFRFSGNQEDWNVGLIVGELQNSIFENCTAEGAIYSANFKSNELVGLIK